MQIQDALVVVVVAVILYVLARSAITAYFAAKRRHVLFIMRNLRGENKWSQELDVS